MADQSSILREYLVSLGFKVNESEGKKFDKGLERWDKKANDLAKGLIGVGTAAVTMVASFSYQMEKLYYASKRTDSAASSIKALEYGASRVGVSANDMRGSLEAMARNLRSNPGLTGLLNSLGVKVTGRDKADVLTDLVGQLKKMPFYVGEKYANMFGIDSDTLFMLEEGYDELKKSQELRKQMAQDLGVDTDAAALAGKEMANNWREIVEYAGLFKDALSIAMLPQMKELSGVTSEVLKDWTKIIQMDGAEFWTKIRQGLGLQSAGGGVKLTPEAQARIGPDATAPKKSGSFTDWLFSSPGAAATGSAAQPASGPGWLDRFKAWGKPASKQAPMAPSGTSVSGGPTPSGVQVDDSSSSALFARLEQQYGLPAGLLDRIWATESGRGKYMKSPKGAQGHMGFMPDTAKEFGLKDPNDLGSSAEAAAKKYSGLLKMYGGDSRMAAAAYNWGQGNVARLGIDNAPRETKDYMDKVGGPTNVQTNITVNGSNDPKEAANLIKSEMEGVNSDIVRNLKPKVQ